MLLVIKVAMRSFRHWAELAWLSRVCVQVRFQDASELGKLLGILHHKQAALGMPLT